MNSQEFVEQFERFEDLAHLYLFEWEKLSGAGRTLYYLEGLHEIEDGVAVFHIEEAYGMHEDDLLHLPVSLLDETEKHARAKTAALAKQRFDEMKEKQESKKRAEQKKREEKEKQEYERLKAKFGEEE